MNSLKSLLDHVATVDCPVEIKKKLMDGAITCVKRWGIEKTTLNDIAREAGCARQTVYNYYGSRDAVVLAALLESSRQFSVRLITHVRRSRKVGTQLTAALLFCLEELPQEPYLQLLGDTELSPLFNQELFSSELCLGIITDCAREILIDSPKMLAEAQEIGEIMTRILMSLLLIEGPKKRGHEELRDLIERRFLPGLLNTKSK